MNKGKGEWHWFGWQGMAFKVPESWSLGAVHGDQKAGYVRLDDSRMARLELKWETTARAKVEQIAERYIGEIEKGAKKSGVSLRLKRHLALVESTGQQVSCFHWRNGHQGYGLVSWCVTCRRVLFMRVLFRPKESALNQVRAIFTSLRDHAENNRTVWSIYGLCFETPADFRLERYQFFTGRLSWFFQRSKEQLQIERFSVANMLLQDGTLEEWFVHEHRNRIAEPQIRYRPEASYRHPVLQADGLYRRQEALPRRLVKSLIRGKPTFIRCYAWYCPARDRIVVVRYIGPEQGTDPAWQVVASMTCH